jgi:transforming growth factor-beta-induced protein
LWQQHQVGHHGGTSGHNGCPCGHRCRSGYYGSRHGRCHDEAHGRSSAVPATGSGSFDGMAKDPAATAASNNPLLSTLVAAVKAAGLVDTLNGPGPFTIFAPVSDAFAKIPKETLDKLLADPKGDLTKILTQHVVSGKMDADALVKAGSVKSLNGADLKITKDGDMVKINGSSAVICGNVTTGNAIVHIIDTVLTPA